MHWIDPDCLPETKGNVERFLVNHHGEIDGVVLGDAAGVTLIHIPPHLSAEIEAAIQIGDPARVRGVRPRGASMVAAVALIAADGRTIVDRGSEGRQDEQSLKQRERPYPPKDVKVAGTVRLSLYSPKGELRGALLDGGTIVRIAPKHAHLFADLLQPGASAAVRGEGIETPHGRVVEVREIGSDLESLMPVKGQGAE